MKYRWACEDCWDLKDAIEIGSFPSGSLILQKGKYKILGGQGHGGDEILTFVKKPVPEPPDGNTKEDSDRWFKWHSIVTRESKKFDLYEAIMLYKSAKRFGYKDSKDGDLWAWLYNKAAKLIIDFENKQKRINKKSKRVESFKKAWDHYMDTGNDYRPLLNAACKARDIDPVTVAEYMGKIPEPK